MLTKNQLKEIEARCDAATLGPWANTDNVKQLFNIDPFDWWKVYAKNSKPQYEWAMVICSMTDRCTEEEKDDARKGYFSGEYKMCDPGQAGVDARFIAHARTDIPLLIAAYREQQEELENYKRALPILAQTIMKENFILNRRMEMLTREQARKQPCPTIKAPILAEAIARGITEQISKDIDRYSLCTANECPKWQDCECAVGHIVMPCPNHDMFQDETIKCPDFPELCNSCSQRYGRCGG